MEIFEPFDVYRGLTFHSSHGKIQPIKTAANLKFVQFYHDIHSYDASGFDLVITDFEPISARIAHYWRIPSIGLGHQYAFCYDIPIGGANPLTRWIIRNFAKANHRIGFHWHHFNQPILPPIIPSHLKSSPKMVEKKILVYLPFEDQQIVELVLRPLKNHQFFIYGGTAKPRDETNLHYRPFSRTGFLNDLMDCEGVICNAGFQLPSEVLHLGKKLLVRPLSGQMEQISNALALSRLNLGTVMSRLEGHTIASWLNSRKTCQISYPNVAELLAGWIGNGGWQNSDLETFAASIWNQTEMSLYSET